jgi:GAF domain-containing protein
MTDQQTGDQLEQTWLIVEDIARSLNHRVGDLASTLEAIGQSAVKHVGPARECGIILLVRGQLVPQCTTGPAPHALDLVQQALGDGPCVAAARDQEVVVVAEMSGEARWPEFAAAAVADGVSCMLCVPLWVQDRRLGALSLYSDRAFAFEPQDLAVTRLFAAQAAIALNNAQRTQQFQAALDSRDVIGQAKGILVERRRLTPEDAFACLSLASQAANRKLVDIARHLSETGELIGIDVPVQPSGR